MANIISNFFSDMRRSKSLRSQARQLGLCNEWHGEWRDYTTQQGLIEKYIRGIDFCIAHNFPTLDYIKENFSLAALHANGIYVDDWVSAPAAPSPKGIAVLLGISKMTGDAPKNSVTTIYAQHDSTMEICATQNARLFIHAYDNAHIRIGEVKNLSKVFIYPHSPNVKIEADKMTADIKIRHNHQK